jgi:hypothetical protein
MKRILYDRLDAINKAFDSIDKARVRKALHTCFDSIAPYLDANRKSRLNKKIEGLQNISDKEEFFKEAYRVYEYLLKVLKTKNMLE